MLQRNALYCISNNEVSLTIPCVTEITYRMIMRNKEAKMFLLCNSLLFSLIGLLSGAAVALNRMMMKIVNCCQITTA